MPFLDGIRGLALLLVLFSHMGHGGVDIPGIPNFIGVGKQGVALFFILSAFLLYRRLISANGESIEAPVFWRNYLLRRFFRIYPAYILVLGVFAICGAVGLISYDTMDFIRGLFLLDGYRHLWAIPVEFSFYLALPAIVVVFHVMKLSFFLRSAVLLLGTLASIVWGAAGFSVLGGLSFISYFALFGIGMMLAELESHSFGRWPAFGDVSALIGVALILLGTPSILSGATGEFVSFDYNHHNLLLLGIGPALLLLGVVCGGSISSRAFSYRWVRWVGLVSFSAYLFHPFLLFLVKGFVASSFQWIVFIGATFFTAFFMYRLIEVPGMKLGGFLARSRRLST